MFNKTAKNGKSAFTLAEVLITLVVIGIIAAITIPILNQKYTNHSLYSGFMKEYNTITNALEMSKAENGAIDTWVVDRSDQDAAREKYIYPYVKYAEICDGSEQGSCIDYSVKGLSGDPSFSLPEIGVDKALLLQDGSILFVIFDLPDILFYFDTNGTKGPNIIGRDFFVMDYGNINGKPGFYVDGDFSSDDCNTSSGLGQGCPAKLLGEGKMNY